MNSLSDESTKHLPTLVVAEMACAHEGRAELAMKIVAEAAAAQADAIQLQLFSAQELVPPGTPVFERSKQLELRPEDWRAIVREARNRSLTVWANVFDEDMVQLALEEGVSGLKLHSTDLGNPRMLDAVRQGGRRISLGTGGTTLDEIGYAVRRLEAGGADDIVLMHGFQAFPTKPEDCHLSFLSTLRSVFGHPVGYQDHTDGDSLLAHILPLVAIGFGAEVLEKHITLSRAERGTDYESSLDGAGFASFVQLVRTVDKAAGSSRSRALAEAELVYRKRMKRSIFLSQAVEPLTVLTVAHLAFLRGEGGFVPSCIDQVVGRCVSRHIPAYTALMPEDLS